MADLTPEGREERCFAFFAMCAVGEFDEPVLYRARLSELVELYDVEDLPGSPSNMWPEDRSWFVYTDWDLWGTKVSGSRDLINRLTSDADVETVSLHG